MRWNVLCCVIALAALGPGRGWGEEPPGPAPGPEIPSGGSPGDDDCTVGEVVPILTDAPDYPVERRRNGPRELVERTRLAPGLTVDVAQGGCADYGVRMTFTSERRAGTEPRRPERQLAEARELLAALRRRTRSDVVAASIRIVATNEHEPYEDGGVLQDRAVPDATVDVSARDAPEGRIVEVTYSFAL